MYEHYYIKQKAQRPGSRDGWHLMPVITPAYPSMCATFNITKSALKVIKGELKRAAEISNEIMVGKRQWSDLFSKHAFFTSDYRYYISTISASTTKEAHKVWSGFVESKVRLLVQSLETHPSIALARPFNKGYDRVHRCQNEGEIHQVQDGSLSFQFDGEQDSVGLKQEVGQPGIKQGDEDAVLAKAESGTEVYTTTHYIGIELNEGEFFLLG
jgi:poly(A) polymerase